jgi:hypothetical protein
MVRGGGDDDRIEWRLFGPALIAVAHTNVDITIA